MKPLLRALAILLPVLSAGCGGDDAAFTGAAAVSYDGVWTGTAQRVRGGERACPAPTPFVVTIANGRARGEVRDRRDRAAVVSRFDAVVDPDGRLVARAWYNSSSNEIALDYGGTRFSGTITTPNDCFFSLRLSRG